MLTFVSVLGVCIYTHTVTSVHCGVKDQTFDHVPIISIQKIKETHVQARP